MNWLRTHSYAAPVLAALVIFLILNALASPAFLDPDNWNGLLVGAAPFIIIAMAQTPAILSGDGGIDMSVGPLAGVVNALVTVTLMSRGWSDPISIIGCSLAVGVVSGLINGVLIAVVRVQPIIATLGTYLVYQGLAVEILPMAGGTAPEWLRDLAGTYAGVPGMVFLFALIAAAWLLLERTAFKRNLLAVGGDARAAYSAGVNVAGVRILAYVISGVLAAIAGLAFTAALGSGDPRVGTPYTLTSIASVALGGVAMTGGRGGMLGAAAAGALLFLIQTLCTLAQVSIFYLQIFYGLVLIVALALNAGAERARHRRLAAQVG
ncbi:MAG: ABC transporter permease [Ancalomicrobiaceae bacterium]|nr:ABC transporter permease [Ancalomicrobiaceae bacterium]